MKISLKCGYDGYLYRMLFKCSVNCMEHRLNIWISNYLLEHTLLVIQLFESFPLGGVESLPRCTNSCGNNGVAVYPYKQLRKRKEVIIVSHCISDFFPFTVQVDIFFGDNLFCGISLVDLFIHFDDVQGIVSFQLTLKKHTSVSITV